MKDRNKVLQAIGSLLGRSAGHCVLYGDDQREVILYREQARSKLLSVWRLHRGEEGVIKTRARQIGGDTIKHAFREADSKTGVLVKDVDAGIAALDTEIAACWSKMVPEQPDRSAAVKHS